MPIPRPKDPMEAAELMHQLAAVSRTIAIAKEELRDLEPTRKYYGEEAFDLAFVVHKNRMGDLLALERQLLEAAGAIRAQFPNLAPPFVPMQLDAEQSKLAATALLFALGRDPEFPPSSPAPAAVAHLVDLAGHLSLSELALLAKRQKLILGNSGDAEVLRAAMLAHPTLLAGDGSLSAHAFFRTVSDFIPV